MMSFKKFFVLQEAIRLKDAKKKRLIRKRGGAYKINSLKEVFGNKDRLVYPLSLDSDEVDQNNDHPLITAINDFFESYYNKDFTIHQKKDYIKGIVYKFDDKEKKQPRKIGRLLNIANNSEAQRLADAFKNDPYRKLKDDNYFVVISRHPYDIAGMSTDRNWRSCMTLGIPNVIYKDEKYRNKDGIHKRHVENDIQEGSIVAYLVSSEEMNAQGKVEIRRPLSRILMKPFENIKDSNDIVFSLGRMYGNSVSKFSDFVKDWLIKNVNKNTDGKEYVMKGDLYSDDDNNINFKVGSRNKNKGSEIFFEDLNDTHDNSKYERFFEFSALTDNTTDSELKITFEIPKDVPLDEFYYGRNNCPSYIKEILKLKTLPEWDAVQSVDSFITDRTIVIEYRFNGFSLYYEDDKGNTIPEDDYQVEEFWDYTFRRGEIKRIDYKTAKKEILTILRNFDIVPEREIEKNKLTEYLYSIFDPNNPAISPNLKGEIEKVNNGYEEYMRNKNYFDSISNISLEELAEISKTEEYKRAIRSVYEYMKSYNNMINRMHYLTFNLGDRYPILRSSARDIWWSIVDEQFPVRKNLINNYNIAKHIRDLNTYSDTHTKEEYEYIKDVLEDQDTAFGGKTYSLEKA